MDFKSMAFLIAIVVVGGIVLVSGGLIIAGGLQSGTSIGMIVLGAGGLLVMGIIVIAILWFIFKEKYAKPTEMVVQKHTSAALAGSKGREGKAVCGYGLYARGDAGHSAHREGTIIGWVSLRREDNEVEYEKDARTGKISAKMDEKTKKPVVKRRMFEEDKFRTTLNERGERVKVLVAKKGDTYFYNESVFLVKDDDFISSILHKPRLYYIPEDMHTELVGDIFSFCFSFVPMAYQMVPNTEYASERVNKEIRTDVRIEEMSIQLDWASIAAQKAIEANPYHQMERQIKKELPIPDMEGEHSGNP